MSNRFAQRVQSERATLDCINRWFPDGKLHGVSLPAVAAWDQSVDWPSLPWDRRRILDGLYRIGSACQAQTDQSRGAFDAHAFDHIQVSTEIANLSGALAAMAGASDIVGL
jgi:hypothetical protein